MKKALAIVLVLAMVLSLSGIALAKYPDHDFNGTIMWGAGGVCDVTSRAITAYAEKIMGRSIVMTNRSGGGGAIATAYVNEQPANGYELLFGAENPQIAKVMGTSDIDYDQFTPNMRRSSLLTYPIGINNIIYNTPICYR